MNLHQTLENWQEVRRGLHMALARFTDADLSFRPARNYDRTVADIALHIGEAEAGWVHFAMRGELGSWPMFTREDYPTWQAIAAVLDEVHAKTQSWLATLRDQDLAHSFTAPWGDDYVYGDIIWHVLEHEIHHRGELFLCLGILGRDAPEI